eukprot:184541_1
MDYQNNAMYAIDSTLQYINNYNFNQADYNENLLLSLPCSPAAERNKAPIFEQLIQFLPESGIVLEIGSRHGQHCQYFAEQILSTKLHNTIKCKFQPTDYINECFHEIQQRTNLSKFNIKSLILKPKILNLLNNWELKYANNNMKLIYIANVIHISEWKCTIGLFRGSSYILNTKDKLILYGPFIINDGKHQTKNESNMRFSINLKARNQIWGVRNLDEVTVLADKYGLKLAQKINMPANNYVIVFEKR